MGCENHFIGELGERNHMKKISVAKGIIWVEVPEAGLYMLCGCPADSVKHLMKRGLIVPTEKNGVPCETGPNAILLSDRAMQNGEFANLSEFPVLQMLYRQGMILPNHPSNTGEKPMLIGLPDQVEAQAEYIMRGNYGLTSEQEIIQAGVPAGEARDMMRLKLKFAFNHIRKTEDLIELKKVGQDTVELKNGVVLTRRGLNVYQVSYKDESVVVNLNLGANDKYESPISLGAYHIRKDYFSVVHIGEGDGWDVNRGCMSSLITFQGRLYLIDAPPNIQHILTALGFSVNEIDGVFHTHAHDDHFAGLTTLIRSGRMIKYYATPLVRASVVKKLSTLMSLEEEMFANYFEIHDLECDKWNDIEGLEVMPSFSAHPVETTIMFFRTLWGKGYRTYAHLADIIGFKTLKNMITDDPSQAGITTDFYEETVHKYLTPVDLKKIDNGGGMIHGVAEDFRHDTSKKIILSHSALELSDAHKEIGSNAVFGMEDVLIHSKQDYNRRSAYTYLNLYYPQVPKHQILMLLNSPIETFNAGSILIRKGEKNEDIFLILSGVLEYIDAAGESHQALSVGSMIGEYSRLKNLPAAGTYRAASYIDALRISGSLFKVFADRNDLHDKISKTFTNSEFLQKTWLLGDMLSYSTRNRIAEVITTQIYEAGEEIRLGKGPELIMLERGELRIHSGEDTIDIQKPGDFLCEESIVMDTPCSFRVSAARPSTVKRIPGHVLENIPIVQWKLLGILESRRRFIPAAPTDLTAAVSGDEVCLEWQDNSNNETGFRIMRKEKKAEAFDEVALISADITTFTDTVPEPGDYQYTVISTNEAGDSPTSNVADATLD